MKKTAEDYLKENCKLEDWANIEDCLNDFVSTTNCIHYMREFANQSKWIGVDEALPEKMVPVLCINTQGYMKVGAFWVEEKYFSGDDSYNNITHWQPLPTPPQI